MDKNCLLFAFNIRQNYCELFSSQNFYDSELMSQKNSQVYRKFNVNHQDITSTFATTGSTKNIVSFNSIAVSSNFQYNSCPDNLSYFSITQNKCVKCRDGWLGYKNVCYKGFTDTKNWQNFVDYCALLNSTMIIADNDEKFKFFQEVSKSLTLINNEQRTWVYARYEVINQFKWMNSKPINISNIMQSTTSYTGCFAYYTTPNSYLSVTLCSLRSNGICEYDY
ncbi:early activation antigen CD69 [Brachionus plicatilis]|uniref:Early activation antigen CD69 n=1 Tax=Brachionus plicatilis TaxID=10195 RepID=A0A3M7R469_BRAPC|nr:early activation antigen CD69 [Brachionus plicatilis]